VALFLQKKSISFSNGDYGQAKKKNAISMPITEVNKNLN
jgi:hypothetical protein